MEENVKAHEAAEYPSESNGDRGAQKQITDESELRSTSDEYGENTSAVSDNDKSCEKDVIHHTAGMWRYAPVPKDEPDPAPEYLSDYTELPGSRIIAARVRGKKHKHEGTNCDDWYAVSGWNNVTCIAVADGAGSKKYSRIGAKASCEKAVAVLKEKTEELFTAEPALIEVVELPVNDAQFLQLCSRLAYIVQTAAISAREKVQEAHRMRLSEPAFSESKCDDFSSTLLLALIVPAGNEKLVITCQIGDGLIAILDRKSGYDNAVKIMGNPDSGEFSGETEFLTSSKMQTLEALQSRTKISKGNADLMLMMSDGVADDYFPAKTEVYRLYYDLLVNGILDFKNETSLSWEQLTQEQMSLFKKIPEPDAYPWVNDPDQKVTLQYTRKICGSMACTYKQLWEDPIILQLAHMQLETIRSISAADERLKVWLDNYVERGSFDDRTLVIADMTAF